MKKLTRTMVVKVINAKVYDKVTDEIMSERIIVPENEKTENYLAEDVVILNVDEAHDSTIRVSIPMNEFINFVVNNNYYEERKNERI